MKLSPSITTNESSHKKRSRLEWHRIFYVLAVLDVLGILLGVGINHQVVKIYDTTVASNQEWSERHVRYATLVKLAGEVASPGYEVFDSRDANGASLKMRSALDSFDRNMAAAEEDLRKEINEKKPSERLVQRDIQKLSEDLSVIKTSMSEMTGDAGMVLSSFRQQQPDLAGKHMAMMDKRYANVRASIGTLREHIMFIQRKLFKEEMAAADALLRLEYLIAAVVLLLNIGTILYGYKIKGQMESGAREKERYLADLEFEIIERKRLEAELKQANEVALESVRLKSDFLANMSHEIRTPMNGIMGMTELTLDTNLTSTQRQYLEMVKTSADSLLTIINDILDFSKIDAGKLDLDPTCFDLRDSLADTVKVLALRAHEKDLELAFHVALDVPDAVVGDPGRLRQIIINLVGNAIKFTEKGEVVVRVRIESQTEDAVLLHFAVSDSGIGIPIEKQRLIFEAFSQADTSTTRTYGGTGLGLTICSRLVEMMNGSIWVESNPGVGSTFQFTARLTIQTDLQTQPKPATQVYLKGLPVLVVDDNLTNRLILNEILTCWRMKPTVVDSGKSALAAMEEAYKKGEPYALVLLDCHMPGMDGFTLTERIRQNPHLARAAIMMLTSGGRGSDINRCRELDIAAYLIKPIKQSELLDSLLRALDLIGPEVSQLGEENNAMSPERRSNLHILLAEDNVINQKLAVRLLEKQGHTVVTVGNGQEALAAMDLERFDVVLMDVQMPTMGGFEATAAIRARERDGNEPVPIVAMTANAMKGDRERCLEAGMDGYVSKPVQPEKLYDEIERMISISVAASLESGGIGSAESPTSLNREGLEPAFDSVVALERMSGDQGLLREIAKMFLDDCPRFMSNIRQAVASGDAEALTFAAHTLKGVVGNFCAEAAADAAQRLETIAERDDLDRVVVTLANLENEIGRLSDALRLYYEGQPHAYLTS